MKIKGVSIWIWLFGFTVMAMLSVTIVMTIQKSQNSVPLEIVKKQLWKVQDHYEVRGQVFNPRKAAAKNVQITFGMLKCSLGPKDQVIETKKEESSAVINYLPPGATVDFTTVSSLSSSDVVRIDEGKLVEQEK